MQAVGFVGQWQHFSSLSVWTKTFSKPLAARALLALDPMTDVGHQVLVLDPSLSSVFNTCAFSPVALNFDM